ncbi:hypothetical protein ACKVMT_16695 [Halobacteriales archaeon Cl-PHB]
MSQGNASLETGEGATDDRGRAGRPGETAGGLEGVLRWGMQTGAFAAVGAGLSLLGSLRDLRRGEPSRALGKALLGGLFGVMAVTQRWPVVDVPATDDAGGGPPVDRSAIADTGPAAGTDEAGPVASQGAERGATTAPTLVSDYEKDAETLDATASGAEGGSAAPRETYDRLGEAAIDGQSRRVPAPQRAFDRRYLASGGQVHWGVRDADDAVVVSRVFDPLQDDPGVRYLGSSDIGVDSRLLQVPDAVLDHWDAVYGGGTAVSGGDGLVFLRADALDEDRQLRVVPGDWVADVLET